MEDNSRISTSKAPKPVGLYPHARKVGNLLFLSGVGPRIAGSDATDSGVPGLELDKMEISLLLILKHNAEVYLIM